MGHGHGTALFVIGISNGKCLRVSHANGVALWSTSFVGIHPVHVELHQFPARDGSGIQNCSHLRDGGLERIEGPV